MLRGFISLLLLFFSAEPFVPFFFFFPYFQIIRQKKGERRIYVSNDGGKAMRCYAMQFAGEEGGV